LTHCEPVERVQVSVPSAAGAAWIDLPQSPRQPGLHIIMTLFCAMSAVVEILTVLSN